MHDRRSWLAWQQVAEASAPYDECEASVRFLLEQPTHYELCRILREFPQRDETLNRFQVAMAPAPVLSPEEARPLVLAHAAELEAVRAGLTLDLAPIEPAPNVTFDEDAPADAFGWNLAESLGDARRFSSLGPKWETLRAITGGP